MFSSKDSAKGNSLFFIFGECLSSPPQWKVSAYTVNDIIWKDSNALWWTWRTSSYTYNLLKVLELWNLRNCQKWLFICSSSRAKTCATQHISQRFNSQRIFFKQKLYCYIIIRTIYCLFEALHFLLLHQ